MRHAWQPATVLLLGLLTQVPCRGADDWPQFRGPDGQGHASQTGLALTWSDTENVVWKTPIAGLGWSSPSIQGDQIWLTSALDEGHSLRAVCVHRRTGDVLHDVEVFAKDDPGSIHSKNSHASPTPLVKGRRVFVHYGAHGTACVSTKGDVLWRNTELTYNHRHGPGGSPVLYEDLLILSCDGTDVAFVVALDQSTGQIRWKKNRVGPMAYCTPLVIRVGGRDQLVSPGGNQVVAYDPDTGDEIWRCRYDGFSVIPRPVFGGGLVFFSSGYNNPVLYAVRPDGAGDVTDTHVAWNLTKGAPHSPSPLWVEDDLFVVSDGGIATCLDARTGTRTGTRHWQERLEGSYSASPLYAEGRVYFTSEDGLTTVVAAGREFNKLAENQVPGRTLASLAVAGKAIFLRTDTHLYRIENPPDAP